MRQIRLYCLIPLILAGCATAPMQTAPAPCKCAPVEQKTETKPAAPALVAASFSDLPGWNGDDLQTTFKAFVAECDSLQKQALWRNACVSARGAENTDLKAWFESQFR